MPCGAAPPAAWGLLPPAARGTGSGSSQGRSWGQAVRRTASCAPTAGVKGNFVLFYHCAGHALSDVFIGLKSNAAFQCVLEVVQLRPVVLFTVEFSAKLYL